MRDGDGQRPCHHHCIPRVRAARLRHDPRAPGQAGPGARPPGVRGRKQAEGTQRKKPGREAIPCSFSYNKAIRKFNPHLRPRSPARHTHRRWTRLVFIDVPYITAGIPFLEFPFPRVIVVPALSVFRKAFIAPVPCTVSYAFSHQVSPCSAHVPVNLKSILLFRVKNFLADPGKNGLRPPATFSRPACGRYGARYKSTSVRAA